MLNPALMAVVLAGAAESFEFHSGKMMPFEYSFLIAPLVLHRESRDALPSRIDSHMTKWVLDHPVLTAGLPARAQEIAPYVREGLRFGLNNKALRLRPDGTMSGQIKSSPRTLKRNNDLSSIVRGSGFVGRWLTTAPSSAAVYSLFGVTP